MESFPIDPLPIGWYLVAFSDEVPTGEVQRMRYFGQDLVCYRGSGGTVNVMNAYCPHQGAHLGWGGEVIDDDLVCPFHSWRFGADGCVVRIPYAETDTEARLTTYPVLEQDGMVFMWYHPDHADPTWEPGRVSEFSDPSYPPTWKSDPIEIDVHPQDVYENGVDAAHFVSVHKGFAIPDVNVLKNDGPHFIAELPDQQLRSDRGKFTATTSSEYWGLGVDIARMETGFMSIIYVLLQTPVDETTTRFHFHITVKKLNESSMGGETPEFVAKIGQGIVAEFLNDKVIWQNKVYRDQPRLAATEEPVREYRRWASQFYPSQLAASGRG